MAKKTEDAIISYILYTPNIDYDEIIDKVKEEYFCVPKYQKVINVINKLKDNGEIITQNTILSSLKKTDFLDLTDLSINSGEFKFFLKRLKQDYISRITKNILKDSYNKLTDECEDEELDLCIYNLQKELSKIQLSEYKHKERETTEIIDDYLINLQDIKDGKTDTGLLTGYDRLDREINGQLSGNNIITIIGRSGGGKSAMAINITANLLNQGKNVLYYSIEMNEKQIIDRLIGCMGNIETYKLKNRQALTDEEYKKIGETAKSIANSGLILKTDCDVDSNMIMKEALLYKKQNKLDCIIIDHIHELIKNEKGADDLEKIARITKVFKNLSKTLNVPIILLAQISKQLDKYAELPPTSDMIRGSSEIYNVSSVILALHTKKYDENGKLLKEPEDNIKDLMVAIDKNREGSQLYFLMDWNIKTQKIGNEGELHDGVYISN